MAVLKHTNTDNTREDVLVCNKCTSFFKGCIPYCDVAKLVIEKETNEKFADEIDTILTKQKSSQNGDAEVSTSSSSNDSNPTLSMERQLSSDMAVQESFELLTYNEVVEKYKKSPNSLRLRCFNWMDNKRKQTVLYWKADEVVGKKLLLTTRVADVAHRCTMKDRVEAFPSQAERCMKAARANTMRLTMQGRDSNFLRPLTEDQILHRVATLNKELQNRKSSRTAEAAAPVYKSATDCAETGDEVAEHDEDDMEAEGEESEEEGNYDYDDNDIDLQESEITKTYVNVCVYACMYLCGS